MLMIWYIFQIFNKPQVKENEKLLDWITLCHNDLEKKDCQSLLKKKFSTDIYEKVKLRKTIWGSTIKDVINTGLINDDCGVGVYAPDPDAYLVFSELYDPIIEDYHGFTATQRQPPLEYGNLSYLMDIDPTNNFVLSTRIRCCRNFEGFPFISKMDPDQLREVEDKVVGSLKYLPHNLSGAYYPLLNMSEAISDYLFSYKFLFSNDIKILRDAGAYCHWPAGRGIFHNFDRTFLLWVNSEDHLRLLSMQKGGNLKTVYARIVQALTLIDSKISSCRDERLGFLTFSPIVLGTTLRVTFEIKLRHIASSEPQIRDLMQFCENKDLVATQHEDDETVFDISNRTSLGRNEFETVLRMQDFVYDIIGKEYEASAVDTCDKAVERKSPKPYLGGTESPCFPLKRSEPFSTPSGMPISTQVDGQIPSSSDVESAPNIEPEGVGQESSTSKSDKKKESSHTQSHSHSHEK